MKKNVSVLIILVMVFSLSIAFADIDISGLSYEELVELKDKINLAIWNSKEWKEVEVPQGDWIVGEDIPVGKWTVKCADVNRTKTMLSKCEIEWGFMSSKGYLNTYSEGSGEVSIYNPNNQNYDNGRLIEHTLDLKEGMIVRIDDAYAPAIFTPYAGKPSLGF